jgi:hypothetical protein
MSGVFIQRSNLKTDMHTDKVPCTNEVRIRGMLLQDKECHGLQLREVWEKSSLITFIGSNPAENLPLDFQPPKL